jgi:hypothetical protein
MQTTNPLREDFTMPDTQEKPQANASEQPSGSLFRDWWEEIYPRDFINTFKGYFRNHKTFFDEVFGEHWDNKVKPIPFFFACITLVFLAGSISPYENPFEEQPTWDEVFDNMLNENEKIEFLTVLGLEEAVNIKDDFSRYVAAEKQIQNVTGVSKRPITAKHLQEYFEKTNHAPLAARAEYRVLKSKAENELGNLGFTFMLNFFLFYFLVWWRISHRFLKRPHRTPRQTVYVYMYNMSMLLLFVYVPLIFLGDEPGEILVFIPVVALIYILYKGVKVFRYTHNVGFGRLLWASILTNLVIVTLFIPLLFMSSKPKVAAEKA